MTYEEELRLIADKVEGLSDDDWATIKDELNYEYTTDALRKSAAGKYGGVAVYSYFKDKQYDNNSDELLEIQKERIKLNDARTEYKKLIRQEARKESFAEMVQRIICEDVQPIELKTNIHKYQTSNDLLCHLTDIHTGIEIDNYINTFNQDVLKERLEKYIAKIIEIKNIHSSQNCYLVIGEIISGLIHNNLRLQNNMDIMEQFKYVSELISSMLIELAQQFNHISVYVTQGNHSRISPKKEDALDGENMDVLLPFYLKARLQNISNISICDNKIDPEIAMFNIRNSKVFAAHGHKDNPKDVTQNFTMMYKVKPDIILLGHRHMNGLTTVYDTKVIESGCVSGTDAYAMSIRKTNKPEQTVSVIDDNGLVCVYDITL